jgi:anti-anti-sigma factor
MQVKLDTGDGVARLVLNGRFDFNSHRDFRSISEEALKTEGVREIEVDLGGVDYLDSSALGMLLLLREKANLGNQRLALLNCRGIVQQVLDVANFNKLFTIR